MPYGHHESHSDAGSTAVRRRSTTNRGGSSGLLPSSISYDGDDQDLRAKHHASKHKRISNNLFNSDDDNYFQILQLKKNFSLTTQRGYTHKTV